MSTPPMALDAAAIEKAVSELVDQRPAYEAILAFYGPVFAAQAEAAQQMVKPSLPLDSDQATMRQKEGFALIEPASFPMDGQAARTLLEAICLIGVDVGGELEAAASALLAAAKDGTDLEPLFTDVLETNGAIQALAEKSDVSPDHLALLLYLALRPGLEAAAGQLSTLLSEETPSSSVCPICGRPPILGELDDQGAFWAHCSLCWHRWAGQRMVCLSCDNRESDGLEYLFTEAEPEYRVNLCKACHGYLKVVDRRQLKRAFCPPLEQVASLHLDLMAGEKGYQPAVAGAAQ